MIIIASNCQNKGPKVQAEVEFLDISHCVVPLVVPQSYQKWSFGMNSLCCGLLQIETGLVGVTAVLMFLEKCLSEKQSYNCNYFQY